jgi:hypothetical protein
MSPFRGQFSGKPQIWDYRTSGWRLSNNVTSRVVTSRCQGVADFVAEVGAETWITLTLHTPNEAAALAHGH